MTGMVTLSDGGQNYIEFDIVCSVIQAVRPASLAGWKGTKILNTVYRVGGRLLIDLQWKDHQFPLQYPITQIAHEKLAGGEWLRAHMSERKKLYACPRGGDDRMAYKVDCKGIPFYFSCLNNAAIAATEALLNFEKIPSVLLEDVDGVMLFDEIKAGQPTTIADIGHSFMVIYDNAIVDYGIITHEATHAWAFDKWGQYAPPDDTDYTRVIRFSGEIPITDYAKTDPAEDLAEGVRYYVFDPTRMKRKCPQRYNIIKQMMTDENYYG